MINIQELIKDKLSAINSGGWEVFFYKLSGDVYNKSYYTILNPVNIQMQMENQIIYIVEPQVENNL